VLILPDEDEGLSGGFAWPTLTEAWMNRDIGADGFPSDEALTWLVQDNNAGKWAFSPNGDLTQLNATHFVQFLDDGLCEFQFMNMTLVPDVEYCTWYIDEHQLHLSMDDNTGQYVNDYVCDTYQCGSQSVSMLTQAVDFSLLQLTYEMEVLLWGQWGWLSDGTEPFNAYVVFYNNYTCEFLNALNASSHFQEFCEWHVDMRDGVHQLKMQLADFYTDNNFANADGWMQHATEIPAGSVITDQTF